MRCRAPSRSSDTTRYDCCVVVDQYELAHDRFFVWLRDADDIFGIIEYHNGGTCGGWAAWKTPSDGNLTPGHRLEAGGPNDPNGLTLFPSLQCTRCSSHGYIRDGYWYDA